MINKRHLFPALLLLACGVAAAAGSRPADDPLQPFQRLMDASWHLEGSYQEFEWGVGKQSVRSRGYFLVDGKPKLVSEGSWFWHPGDEQIKGWFTAVDMPFVLLEYTTRFEGNKMVNDLRSFAADGSEEAYVETWEFLDDTRYVWKLLKKTPDGLQEVMGGTYSKKEAPATDSVPGT